MKKCVSCVKDLPDTALHCVFCGAKQPAAAGAPAAQPPAAQPPAAGGAANKTVMGYSAAELLKNLPATTKPAAEPPTATPIVRPPTAAQTPAPAVRPPPAAPAPAPMSPPAQLGAPMLRPPRRPSR